MEDQALDSLSSAYQQQFKFHDENLLMLEWYARRIIPVMKAKGSRKMLSLGIGHGVLPKRIIEALAATAGNYTIIEGSHEIISLFRSQVTPPSNTTLVHSFFEEYRPIGKFDAIEMGFVLEHVNDPLAILQQYSQYLEANGALFIAVPNARSLHRLVGYEAGLLDNLHRLSAEDLQLGHQRYFDCGSICRLVLQAGLKVVKAEGILLKPLTSSQLKLLNLSSKVIEGLLKVGVGHPELCNAVLVEGTV